MTEWGDLRETYAAALKHDLIDLEGDERLVGVVRRPLPWLLGQVDENLPELGPPTDLLDAVKTRYEELQENGLSDARAHNQALTDLDYRERYVAYLEGSTKAQEAIQHILEMLSQGEDVVLVCYENTEEKRCHRTILQELIEGVDFDPARSGETLTFDVEVREIE